MQMYGISMKLPDGKIPGFYGQVVKSLAEKARIFDRDKELLIVGEKAHCPDVYQVLEHFRIPYETFPLLHLPENAYCYQTFDDYGFMTRSGNRYLYAQWVAVFSLQCPPSQLDKQKQALSQIEEHLIARYEKDGIGYYITEAQLRELMERIAAAYGCSVVFKELHT